MPTHIGIGFSQEANISEAAFRAATQAKEQNQQPNVDLVIVFNTIHYNPIETSLIIRKIFPQAKIVGCSTAGIILSELISLRGVGVLVITSDEMKFGTSAISEIESQDLRQAGISLAKNCINDLGLQKRAAFIMLFDGLIKDNSPLVKGLHEILGNVFPIFGAGSCDDFHFKNSYEYYQDKVLNNSATGFLLGGQAKLGYSCKHGWKPLGKPRTINQVDGHIIKTIDNKKAISLYEEYFLNEVKNVKLARLEQLAIRYPLGIYIEDENEYILRNAVDILADGSIVCQGEIPEGAEVHIMIGNKESCRQAATDAATEAREGLQGKQPKLVLIFESLGRLKLQGRATYKEIQSIKGILGHNTPIFGMYSHGEIAPLKSEDNIRKTYLQNESIIILAIG